MPFDQLTKYGGYIIAVVVSALLYFFPARRKELDDATTKLIKTLQETVGALERDLTVYKEKTLKLESQQQDNMARITSIEAEKQLLKDFINGRDKATAKFQEECMNIVMKTHDCVAGMMLGLEKNNLMTKEFVDTMKQHLLNVEKVAMQ